MSGKKYCDQCNKEVTAEEKSKCNHKGCYFFFHHLKDIEGETYTDKDEYDSMSASVKSIMLNGG